MHIPDELLSAYVDGRLDPAARARVEHAIAEDARLAHRVAQQRARRERPRSLYERGHIESVARPLAQSAPAGAPAQIIDLARVRAERARRHAVQRHPAPRRIVLAASLAVAVLAGILLEQLGGGSAMTEVHDGTLYARGPLAEALGERLGNSEAAATEIRIGQTFRAKTGLFCRTFSIHGVRALAGLACHDGGQWQIVTLLRIEPPAGAATATRVASGTLPPPLAQVVNERTSGGPLDAQAVAQARANDWR